MNFITNPLKRFFWFFTFKKHVVITYNNGDIDIFPTSETTEIDDFFNFLQEHKNSEVSLLLGGRVKMINFNQVRCVEVIEGINNEYVDSED